MAATQWSLAGARAALPAALRAQPARCNMAVGRPLFQGAVTTRLGLGPRALRAPGTSAGHLARSAPGLSASEVSLGSRNFRNAVRTFAAATESFSKDADIGGEDGEPPAEPETADVEVEDVLEPVTFRSLGVYGPLADRLKACRYFEPTPIQAATIPKVLDGASVGIKSYTGSGKTLAFMLPILTHCLVDLERGRAGEGVYALIVAPSRELGMQIVRECHKMLGDDGKWMVQQAIGGANINRQIDAFKRNKPMIVVGTPGRVFELSMMGTLQTHHCKVLVLDEADNLLSSQYAEDMDRIVTHTGKRVEGGRQNILVSATLNETILNKAATKWGIYKPELVVPTAIPSKDGMGGEAMDASLAPHLEHCHVVVDPRHEIDTLRRTVHALDAQQTLVFHNFARRLKDTEAKLKARRMSVGSLSGDMRKEERHSVLSAFRAGKLRVLLVSDVAARGLDVPDCDLVVNADLPTDAAHYAHRAGRTGRAGRYGAVVSLCRPREAFVMHKFEDKLNCMIPEAVVRNGELRIVDERVVGKGGGAEGEAEGDSAAVVVKGGGAEGEGGEEAQG